VTFLASACSPQIRRYGYTVPEKPLQGSCLARVHKDASFDAAQSKLIGTVSISGSEGSGLCSEAEVVAELRREACSVGANSVNIVWQQRTGAAGPCYVATAELIVASAEPVDSAAIVPIEFSERDLAEAEKSNSRHTAGWIVLGLIISAGVGVAVGFAARAQ
jgi:hypothetical protein